VLKVSRGDRPIATLSPLQGDLFRGNIALVVNRGLLNILLKCRECVIKYVSEVLLQEKDRNSVITSTK
jgi:hypothetical protein